MSNAGFQLDASAVLALLREEPGADRVLACLGESVIHAVNLIEVFRKMLRNGTAKRGRTRFGPATHFRRFVAVSDRDGRPRVPIPNLVAGRLYLYCQRTEGKADRTDKRAGVAWTAAVEVIRELGSAKS